jgi:hypothetical protein
MKIIIILFRRFGSDSRASSRLDSAALNSPGCDSPRPPTQSRDSQPRDIQPGRAHSGRSSALNRERTNSRSPVSGNNRNAGGATTAVDRIDRLFDAPDKIHIPERLAPEPEEDEEGGRRCSREETERRREKVESIRRMLGEGESGKTESLLTLNQIIARQVKQRSRSFASAAAAAQGEESSAAGKNVDYDDERSDSSPDIPLPLRQQRESFLI